MQGRTAFVGGLAFEAVTAEAGLRLTGHDHPHRHICCVVDGSFDEVAPRSLRRCEAGFIRISPAGTRHALHFGSRGATCLLVMLDAAAAAELDAYPAENTYGRLDTFRTLAWPICRALFGGAFIDPLSLEARGWELIAQCTRVARFASAGPTPTWLRRVRERLRDSLDRRLSLTDLARDECVSREHLIRAFAAHFGMSPGDFARRERLKAARRRLLESTEALATVAAQAGFADQSHFTRWCVRMLGATPGEIRRSKRQDVTFVQDLRPLGTLFS